MASHSRAVTKQATELAHKLGYPATWIADQISAQLVPDYRLPWPAQRKAWQAIREVRRRSVPADVVAIQIALHGDRGTYTRRLPSAIATLAGIDVAVPSPADRGHQAAEQAAADLFDGEHVAPTPLAGMVHRALSTNAQRPPMVGEHGAPIMPSDVHATATTVVGLEDMWSLVMNRATVGASREAFALASAAGDPAYSDAAAEQMFGAPGLRGLDAMFTLDEVRRIREGTDDEGWATFLAGIDRALGGRSPVDAMRALLPAAGPDVLVAAVRGAAETPFDAAGIDVRQQRNRANIVAGMSLFLLLMWAPAIPALRQAIATPPANELDRPPDT